MTDSMEVKYNKNSILRDGYGIIPKIVMRDKNLSIEAKAIYAYLIAFAGDKKTCYPSRDLMCKELGISINRFTKHLKTLKESGYIKVERVKSGNLKAKNIYEIMKCCDFFLFPSKRYFVIPSTSSSVIPSVCEESPYY